MSYNLKNSIPNKLYNADGSVTDLLGNIITNSVDEYKNKPALPNKFLNADGSYSTLGEILSGAIDTDLFIIVEELPSSGEPNKIYLLIDGNKLIEYAWVNNSWDPIGMIEFDLNNYYTKNEVAQLIATSLTNYVTNTDYASSNVAGVIKTNAGFDISSSTGLVRATVYSYANYDNATNVTFIGKGTLENVINNSILLIGDITPTTSTIGYRIGQLYINSTDDTIYQLTNIDNSDPNNIVYTWQQLIRSTDYATNANGGVMKTSVDNAFGVSNGLPYSNSLTYNSYNQRGDYCFIGKGTLENVLNNAIILKSNVAPTTSTIGYKVGQLYINTTDNKVYQLASIDDSDSNNIVYNWQQLIRATDYASQSNGGVVKLGYGFTLNSVGQSVASEYTYQQYANANNATFIGKGTLENVITGKELVDQTALTQSQQAQNELINELIEDNKNLRNALPSVSGIGSNIILEGTSKNKFKKFEVDGDTKQTQYEGRNLLPEATEETKSSNGITVISDGKGKYKINGTASANTQIYFDLTNSFTTSNETLYAHLRNNAIAPLTITIGNTETASSPSCSSVNRIMTSDLLSNLLINRIGFIIASGETVDVEVEPSIELTNTMTDYEPFVGGIVSPNKQYQQPIKNVVGNIENVISNKNVIDVANPDGSNGKAVASLSGNILTISSTTTTSTPYTIYRFNDIKVGDIIRIKGIIKNSNGRITLRKYENGAWKNQKIQNYTDGITPITIEYSVEDGIKAVVIYIHANNEIPSAPSESNYEDVIMTINTTDMTYIPHIEQNLPFTLAEGERLYKDSKLQDDGKHHKRTQIILNGTEDWSEYGTTGHVFILNMDNIKSSLCYCTHYIGITTGILTTDYSCLTNNNAILINDKDVSTVEDFKTLLATQYTNDTPVIVEYALGEEQIVPYNSTQQTQHNVIKKTMSYDDMTIITSESTELGANLNVEVIQNSSSYKAYADTKEAEAVATSNNYTDTQIQTSITNVLADSY